MMSVAPNKDMAEKGIAIEYMNFVWMEFFQETNGIAISSGIPRIPSPQNERERADAIPQNTIVLAFEVASDCKHHLTARRWNITEVE